MSESEKFKCKVEFDTDSLEFNSSRFGTINFLEIEKLLELKSRLAELVEGIKKENAELKSIPGKDMRADYVYELLDKIAKDLTQILEEKK